MSALHASSRPPAVVPAVARALAVMDLLARERRPLNMAGVAAALALPKSSVHGLCNTLLAHGYLKRTDNGALQIGPGVMSLAGAFVASTTVAGEFEALWREGEVPSGETQVLSVLNGAEVLYVGVRNSARPLGLAFNVGMRLPAHVAASGKAQLAFESPEAVRRRFEGGALSARQLDALMRELAATRERGYGVDDEGVHAGVYCIGAPVFDATGEPVAGLGMCFHKSVLGADGGARHARGVREAADRLTQRLGGVPPAPPAPPAAPRARAPRRQPA